MARFLKTAIVSGLLFGLPFALLMTWWDPPLREVDAPSGLNVAGLFQFVTLFFSASISFGLLIAVHQSSQAARLMQYNPCSTGERLIHAGLANHRLSWWEWAGGGLFLTNKRLVFRPHGTNIHNQEVSLLIEDLVDAESCSVRLAPIGLRVTTDAEQLCFSVEDRTRWVEYIKQAKERIQEAALDAQA